MRSGSIRQSGMTSWHPRLCCGCGAEWSGYILSTAFELESTKPEIGWMQLVKKVKENPGFLACTSGKMVVSFTEIGSTGRRGGLRGGVMCSALSHWFLDACGTSQQIWRTQLQIKRESSQLYKSDKLCSSLFSAARWADWLVIKYIRVEPYFSFGVAVGH